MKLNDKILLSDLEEQFSVIRNGEKRHSAELRFVQIYEKNMRLKTGGCYLLRPEQKACPEHLPPDSLLITMDKTQLPAGLNAICVLPLGKEQTKSDGDGSFFDLVLNEVIHIFDFYQTWEDRLMELQMDKGTLREMLEASLPVFRTTLVLTGTGQNLYAVASDMPVSGEYTQFRTNRELIEEMTAMLRGKHYAEYDKSDLPYVILSQNGEQRAVFLNLKQNKSTTHRLCCIGDPSMKTEKIQELTKKLAPYVRYRLYHVITDNGAKNDTLTKVLMRILGDRSFDYLEASQNLCELGWQTQQQYLCMVLSTTYVDQRKLTHQEICNYMEEHYPNCTCFVFRDDLVAFFNLSLARITVEELMERQSSFLKESILKAGYSRPMTGHMNLRRQYIQAAAAMDVGSRKAPYRWVHQFDEISMSYILEQCTRRLPGSMLAHEKLLLLKDMDEKNGTEYLKTLKIYLDRSQNAVHTAKELFIHRSTFLYRLDKIRQILESDLEDPEEILYLQLSFRLLEQEEKKEK